MGAGPKAPTRRTLTREYLFESALYLIDRQGLAGLNLRALGRQMGVSQTAIYRHVPSKDALLDGVVEFVWNSAASVVVKATDMKSWQVGLESAMMAVYRILKEHPNALPLLSTHPINTQQSYLLLESWLKTLSSRGMVINDKTAHLFNSTAALTLGWATAQLAPSVGSESEKPSIQLVKDAAKQSSDMEKFIAPLLSTSDIGEQGLRYGLHALINGWSTTN